MLNFDARLKNPDAAQPHINVKTPIGMQIDFMEEGPVPTVRVFTLVTRVKKFTPASKHSIGRHVEKRRARQKF